MKKTSNKFHQRTTTSIFWVIFAGIALNFEKVGPIFSSFNPFPSLPSVTTRLQNSPYFCVLKYARTVKQKVWNEVENQRGRLGRDAKSLLSPTPRQNVYACTRLSISGLFFSHTFQSDQSLPRALGFILCAACGSVVLLHAARVFDYFVVIEIAFMDN